MNSPQMELCHKAYFSCGHRYHNPQWSEEKNKEVFGSCYSEHGHGHNYVLNAFFKGPVNPETGMIINLSEVEQILEKITKPLDHHFLNTDVEEFKTKVPTTENIALWCFDKINHQIQKRNLPHINLSRLQLFESDDLWTEVHA